MQSIKKYVFRMFVQTVVVLFALYNSQILYCNFILIKQLVSYLKKVI